jgi:hemoglobin-like flavoprotein
MTLSALHKRLVRRSFSHLAAHSDECVALFYVRLSELNPTQYLLFRGSSGGQAYPLMQMLAIAINLIDQPALLSAQLRALWTRYNGYGLRAEDLVQAETALMWMLEKQLGSEFTAEMFHAWTNFYHLIMQLTVRRPDHKV